MSKTVQPQSGNQVITHVPGLGIMDAYGTTVPADAALGYAMGCLFRHIDGSANTVLYVNNGTAASANFDAIASV